MIAEMLHSARGAHVKCLVVVFCAWKTCLLVLAAFCPSPGYDTSALILLDNSTRRQENFHSLSRIDRLILNLFRWDAVYFVKVADRGQVHEQEWAFSWAYSHLLRLMGHYVSGSGECPLWYYIVAGVVISHVCHFLSALVLYHLVTLILQRPERRQVALVASLLHVLSPASLFLSAPYTEALFSLLNFTGMLLYAQSKTSAQADTSSIREGIYKLSSGLSFATASMIRSNGLLSGLIYLYDVVRLLPHLLSSELRIRYGRSIATSCLSGALVALGFILPQYVAYREICGGDADFGGRPWCQKTIPSIYTWVQSHYWNVGLFRYWTISNLPLFLIASPMLWILVKSSVAVLNGCLQNHSYGRPVLQNGETVKSSAIPSTTSMLPELALPQLALSLSALTTFHVQIVNRIASGYPTWYIMLATWIVDTQTTDLQEKALWKSEWFVRGMVMYALIQGVLYANFLPPA